MSGIAGYISKNKATKKVIKAMTDRIEHRGKDGEGHYIEENIALGHRLLQTNKKVNGEQELEVAVNEAINLVVNFVEGK